MLTSCCVYKGIQDGIFLIFKMHPYYSAFNSAFARSKPTQSRRTACLWTPNHAVIKAMQLCRCRTAYIHASFNANLLFMEFSQQINSSYALICKFKAHFCFVCCSRERNIFTMMYTNTLRQQLSYNNNVNTKPWNKGERSRRYR